MHNASRRISDEQALNLLRKADTAELMSLADEVRRQKHSSNVYYVHSLNLNPTNVCENRCGLCAFWRDAESPEAYTLSLAQINRKLDQAEEWRLTDVHIVGGLNRELDLDYYIELLRITKQVLPAVTVQALTAVEIQRLSQNAGKPVAEVLPSLKAAGLDAIPGGGAEIFSPRVRENICPKKTSAEEWLHIHQTAHSLGIPSNATMLFGHIETPEEIIDHLSRLRSLQDRTGGFQAFCPLPFHAGGTRIGVTRGPGGYSIARIGAMARIFLHNFPHIRVLANFLDRRLLQVLLFSGADDVGGTSIDEQIARSAGAPEDSVFHSPNELRAFIQELDLTPVLTSSIYNTASACSPRRAPRRTKLCREILREAMAGRRLTGEEAVQLHDSLPFYELGYAAHQRRRQIVGSEYSTFIVDRNISFTNICTVGCKFCAIHRSRNDSDSFLMSIEEIVRRVEEAAKLGAT